MQRANQQNNTQAYFSELEQKTIEWNAIKAEKEELMQLHQDQWKDFLKRAKSVSERVVTIQKRITHVMEHSAAVSVFEHAVRQQEKDLNIMVNSIRNFQPAEQRRRYRNRANGQKEFQN